MQYCLENTSGIVYTKKVVYKLQFTQQPDTCCQAA